MKKIFYFVVAMAATVGLWSCAESESDKVRATAGEIVQGVIDKDFALKYGHNPGNPNFGSDAHPSHASYMERYQGNENRFDWPSYQPALSDDYWKDAVSRDLGQKLPNTFTKNGEFRKVKDVPSRFAKDLYGTDQADKRPLHRKGSLNRVGMPESRMRNIVRESVNKVLAEMSLHKGSSVHRHSSGNWAPSGEGWKWKYDGDRVDRYLWRKLLLD